MSKIEAIVFSDLHLHIWKTENSEMARTHRHFNILYTVMKSAEYYQVPLVFAGDLFHDNYAITNTLLSMTINFFDGALKWFNQPFYFIVGNHDQASSNFIGNTSPNYLSTLKKIYKGRINFIELTHNKSYKIGKLNFYGISYLTNDTALSEIIDEIKVKPKSRNVLVLHTAFDGAVDSNSYEFSSEEVPKRTWKSLFKRFEMVMCGHIHKSQSLARNIMLLGAPIEMRTSDIGTEFGYWELIGGETLSMRRKVIKEIVFNRDKLILDPVKDDRGSDYQIDGPDFSITDVVDSYFSEKKVSKKYKNEFLKLISNDKNN